MATPGAAFEFQGLDTIIGVVSSLRANTEPAVAQRIYLVMTKVFAETQRQVPVRTGVLKASGHLEGPDDGEVSIGYGGPAAEYAVWVHENMLARHRPPTKAKYVEDPMNDAGPELRKLTDDMESAILRQYPQAPAIAAGAEAMADTNKAYNHRGPAARRHAVATSKAFSPSEIRAALTNASAHPGRMIRKRGK